MDDGVSNASLAVAFANLLKLQMKVSEGCSGEVNGICHSDLYCSPVCHAEQIHCVLRQNKPHFFIVVWYSIHGMGPFIIHHWSYQ